MRRITTGVQGGPILGAFTALDNNLQTIQTNTDIILDPDGAGIVKANADIQIDNEGSLRLADNDSSNYLELKAPATVASNITYTLPGTVTDGNFLSTDANGNLSWQQTVTGIQDQVADTATYYPTLVTQTSGGVQTINTSSSRLTFQPSTGRLTVSAFACGSVDIGGGAIDGTPIGASTASTGRFTTITETSSIVYKENISPITDALSAVLKLEGVTYDRKDGSSINEAGLIKEEVEKVLPNLVNGDGIQYTKLTAYLLEAVKSLAEEVNRLKDK